MRKREVIVDSRALLPNGSEDDNCERATLLSKQYQYVCPLAILVYVLLQVFIGKFSHLGDEEIILSDRVYYFYNGAGFSFVVCAIQQIVRIFECRFLWGNKNTPGIYFTVFTVSAIAASSFFLTFSWHWGGVCTDVLGVDSTAAQWAEWLVTVPLMVHMTLAMEDKKSLTSHDVTILAVFVLAISFGFLLNFKNMPMAAGYVMFVLGCCSITVTIVLDRLSGKKFKNAINDHSTSNADYRRALIKVSKRRTLSRLFLAVFPLFPLTHILAQAEVLDRESTIIAYALCSLIAKLLFASSVSDAHMSLADGVNKLRLSAEQSANDKRRNYLRYVFHEVRVPLNTISMGLIVVKEDYNLLSEDSKEAVAMMNGATRFMSDTLNDVLSMQKIEDGKMDLIMKAFSMGSLIKAATTAVKGCADSKNMTISVVSEVDLPMERGSYIGDRFRLEHVLVNFLSNAIKFSPEGSKITVKLSGKMNRPCCGITPKGDDRNLFMTVFNVLIDFFRNGFLTPEKAAAPLEHCMSTKVRQEPPTLCLVTLLVIDEGTGIAKKDLDRLFMPYCQIQPDMLQQGKGTGLGLVLAKEIVSLHGGHVVVTSELGKGSAFGFCIPFELLPSFSTGTASTKVISLDRARVIDRKDSHEYLRNSFGCVETRSAALTEGSPIANTDKSMRSTGNIPEAFSLSMESVIDYERADTLFVLRTDEKEANLKAGRTFLIVDGELSIPVTMYFTVTSSPSSSVTPHH
jgi:signal transduction histidine kinase